MSKVFLGYDPGGNGAHGVAAVTGNDVACATVETAQEAISWLDQQCRGQEPAAIGLDTLTLWSTGRSGWRPADRALRQAYPEAAESVTAPNSLYGSMCINGCAVGRSLRERCSDVQITETHPKVLYYQLTGDRYNFGTNSAAMVQQLTGWLQAQVPGALSEHAWDALISAYAARQWHNRIWTTDLHQLPPDQAESLVWPLGNTAYAWPESIPPASIESDRSKITAGNSAPNRRRARDRWKVAVQALVDAGRDDVAQLVQEYRNTRNERSGWDAMLKSRFPELWNLILKSGD